MCDKPVRIIGLSPLFHYDVLNRTQGGTANEKKDENTVTEKFQVPLWHKANLSIDEAVAYSGIGMAKLYEMTNREDCPFVLWIGNRRVIKRKAFDEYIEKVYSV